MADGNQKIARKYMMAAKIPDSTLDYGWPDSSPDMLDPDELAGPDDNVHHDGGLFDEDGDPIYCQFMSMHWGVGEAEKKPGAVAEVREFLTHPTHFFAECQAVNAFENLDPHGYFLTQKGFLIGQGPKEYDFFQADEPFNQLDGDFQSVGGSEPAYTLPMGETYKASDIVMITEKGTPAGVNDVWMTGFLDGVCPASKGCLTAGKVSYLGGHEYNTDLPISQNPDSQGTRLFLNSLFEAPCATVDGLPMITLMKSAPAQVEQSDLTFTIDYKNEGPTPALAAVLRDPLPLGSTFVEASMGGVLEGDEVRWDLGNLGVGEGGQVTFTVQLGDMGQYANVASLDYHVGLNEFTADSNETLTLFGVGNSTGGSDSNTSGATSAGTGASGSGSASGGESTGASASGTGDASTGASASASGGSATSGAGENVEEGCGCRSGARGEHGPFAVLVLAGPLLLRRRRRAS
ncbi:MAG: DUF11 domain-containing protein [Myxococcales bacterium]|nr:DUF11 domain-containing protein [Myxococcales bacterium]